MVQKAIKQATANWETSSAGILGIIGAVIILLRAAQGELDDDPTTTTDMATIVAAVAIILQGTGLIRARDAGKTSEQSGAE